MARPIHRPLVQAVIEALAAIFREGYHADKVIERVLHGQKKWGARDRRFFAEVVYDCCRWWRKLNWAAGHEGIGTELSEEQIAITVQVYVVLSGNFELPSWLAP